MKRTKSLVASILGTVIYAVQLISSLVAIMPIISLLSSLETGTEVDSMAMLIGIGSIVLTLLLILIALILTCCTYKYINAEPEKYAKGKGVIIATIVFNFLIALFTLIGLFGAEMLTIIVGIITISILIVANVLYIIDLAQEKKKVQQLQAESTPQQTIEEK